MYRSRRGDRLIRDAPTLTADDRAVRGAEEIVRRAWARELLRQCDDAEFAVRMAEDVADDAYRYLSSAQRDGDPRKIAAAHAALERAIEATRESAEAYAQVRRTLRAELNLLTQSTRDHAVPGLVYQIGRDCSAIIVQALGTLGTVARQAWFAFAAATRRSQPRWLRWLRSPRWPRWLRRIAVRRTAQSREPVR